MKKMLIVVALLFAVSSVALAQDEEMQGPRYTIFTKLFRGIGNVIMSPIEIPVSLFNVGAETDVTVGLTLGTLAGVVGGAERLIAGGVDIVTFIFPPYDKPMITYELGKSAAVKAAIEAFPADL
ncbi:exosortase system-associated protein, TIGR04073 family [bacterium]|nr:exosortase system-associated protein, TIGR04073 family [bacterium]